MTTAHDVKQKAHRSPHIAVECSLPSEVTAISPFVDKPMLLLRNCGCVPEGVSDVENRIAASDGKRHHSRKS
jgi:hypothetical protein